MLYKEAFKIIRWESFIGYHAVDFVPESLQLSVSVTVGVLLSSGSHFICDIFIYTLKNVFFISTTLYMAELSP